jgi:hypothetical protein
MYSCYFAEVSAARVVLVRPHINVAMGEWSHVAMTWDADATEDRFRLYVNAELAAAAPAQACK